ncbi:MAG: DUF4411 family protein [Deltaproteobacteria bacterium]|nr:DUF4411 family protein [Deltaproteobacteria bacterium]
MNTPTIFLLDSDVFIAAKNTYYAFAICPGFWKGLIRAHTDKRIHSIDKIKAELLAGRKDEDLVQWVHNDVPSSFFYETNSKEINDAYTEISLWVQRSQQYLDRAKAKFATEADGWLVAYSMVNKTAIVTNEQPQPQSRSRVLLPDVCEYFKVPYQDTFYMLHKLALRFDLAGE